MGGKIDPPMNCVSCNNPYESSKRCLWDCIKVQQVWCRISKLMSHFIDRGGFNCKIAKFEGEDNMIIVGHFVTLRYVW